MNKLTALLSALMALAMMTGPSIAADMAGGEKSISVASEFSKQLSPNALGPGFIPDGVSYEEFGGTIDTHYGVAPAWVGRTLETRTMIEKADVEWRKHLAPKTVGTGYIADGVSYDEFRGTFDTHYGLAPAWEDRPEEPLTINKHLAPNVTYGRDVN